MSGRAGAFAGIRGAESALRKSRRFSFILTISTNALMSRLNTVPSAGVADRLYSVIFEIREDSEGEFYHLVTLWKATPAERKLYEENAL